jgi:hypothetical protein
MYYQVMIRRQRSAAWDTHLSPTNDPFLAMRLLQRVKRDVPDATVVKAASLEALRELIQRMIGDAQIAADAQVFADEMAAAANSRRWELEDGPGGDHDQPYIFELPSSLVVLSRWLDLFARRWRDTSGSGQVA